MASVTDENVLDVTVIEPRLKHPTIFIKFDELANGESLVLFNDHDPKPLYYELLAERGDVFEWQYLQEGPEYWRVSITKKEGTNEEEYVLVASDLAPQVKHPTIFKTFDALQKGESFILQNDHDPRPLYYQLMSLRGDIFTWDYLENGPDVFKIRISKKNFQEESSEPVTQSKSQENILNVTVIEPKLKHPTIFVKFDELKPGEALTIHNDHDPKPLYYQLLGERGNIFTWEYLEEGPQLWRVRITKKLSGETDETLGEIAAKDLRKAEVFKKYGLDFCCGGKKTVKEACEEKGIDVTKVEQELQQADKNASNNVSARALPYNDWSLDFLADYIVNTHHSYVRKTIPTLRQYSEKVAKVHSGQHPELKQINKLVQEVCDEMSEHMLKEESILFPYVKQIVHKSGSNGASFGKYKTIQEPINEMEAEHDFVGRNMEEVREISNNYALPEDACASYSFLFKTLDEFENDLHLHVHLENNILFPKAVALEKN